MCLNLIQKQVKREWHVNQASPLTVKCYCPVLRINYLKTAVYFKVQITLRKSIKLPMVPMPIKSWTLLVMFPVLLRSFFSYSYSAAMAAMQ